MNVVRNFLLLGCAFLIVGVVIGMYMAGSGDHSLHISHAHLNLLGFVLAVLFGLVYRSYPAMTEGRLATIHFWLHFVGAVLLNVMIFLKFSEIISEAAMVPLAPISEALVLVGVLTFSWNVFQNAR